MKQKRKTMTTKTSGTEERNASGAQVNENGKDAKAKKDLHSLLETGLKDIYSAEQQLVAALPEVAQAVDNEELEEAINRHLEQTKKHVSRLEKVFERLGISKTQDEKCMAMEGLVEETRRTISEFSRSPVRDSALIIGAQKIEHYEIAAYGSLCELADVLGEDRICDLLEKTLEEEKETDETLTAIAQDVNDEAYELSESGTEMW
jgi:ferritin-like metal-binding protein YciE